MLICMRTTLNLDDKLMRIVKSRAAKTGRTVSSMIETALRDLLAKEKQAKDSTRLRWTVVSGGVQPGVDLNDRDSLFNRMEGRF